MPRPRRGRISLRDQKIAINKAFDHLSILSGKPTPDGLKHEITPKRERKLRPVDNAIPLEKEVLADALEALRNDPRIWICDRRQSGVFQDGDRYIRVGQKGHLDISGMLHGGRYFELEAKRPGEKPNEYQLKRIAHVRAGGGVSGYFWSVETALALLP